MVSLAKPWTDSCIYTWRAKPKTETQEKWVTCDDIIQHSTIVLQGHDLGIEYQSIKSHLIWEREVYEAWGAQRSVPGNRRSLASQHEVKPGPRPTRHTCLLIQQGGWKLIHSSCCCHDCYLLSFRLCAFHGRIPCPFWNAAFENDITLLFIDAPAIGGRLADEMRVESSGTKLQLKLILNICNALVGNPNDDNKHPVVPEYA